LVHLIHIRNLVELYILSFSFPQKDRFLLRYNNFESNVFLRTSLFSLYNLFIFLIVSTYVSGAISTNSIRMKFILLSLILETRFCISLGVALCGVALFCHFICFFIISLSLSSVFRQAGIHIIPTFTYTDFLHASILLSTSGFKMRTNHITSIIYKREENH